MMISRLSFETKRIEIVEGRGKERYLAFFYKVDGQTITDDEYNPANAYDVMDKEAAEKKLVVLLHCGCGFWECSAVVARVSETSEGLIQWTVSHYRLRDVISEYFFKSEEYDKTMAEIQTIAKEEIQRIEKN